ncbi:MAG: phosphoglycerate kinase [Deltaproteobacteria bacterium]|nr:phosphoglycerate kinase [Deltaproteobacteria bacterium]
MSIQTIDQLDLKNKRVFIRCDFNVPLTADGKIADETRIRESLPTIQYALKKQAMVILASHLGRPNGTRTEKYSLAPVAERLMEELGLPEVIFPEECVGSGVVKLSRELRPGQLMLLENLRFHKGEEAGDETFAKQLAALCDIYIDDAFGVMHRPHSSIVGMLPFVEQTGVGFLVQKEIEFFKPLLMEPKRPFVAILGGAKVSDKIGVIESLLNKVDSLMIGGAMAYTFLKALGRPVGNSKVENDKVHTAKKLLERARAKEIPILLPVDHIIAQTISEDAEVQTTKGEEIPDGWMGVDIGPKTVANFGKALGKARTLFWNGPLGVYEFEKFSEGTYSVAKLVAGLKTTTTIIGGGDSAAAVEKAGLAKSVSHISTGGGAALELIENGTLPGLEALGFTL